MPPEVDELKKSYNEKEQTNKTWEYYHNKVEKRKKECVTVKNEVPKLQIKMLRLQDQGKEDPKAELLKRKYWI